MNPLRASLLYLALTAALQVASHRLGKWLVRRIIKE